MAHPSLETYLRSLFGLVGIEPEFVIAEGLNLSPEKRDASLKQALVETLRPAARSAARSHWLDIFIGDVGWLVRLVSGRNRWRRRQHR